MKKYCLVKVRFIYADKEPQTQTKYYVTSGAAVQPDLNFLGLNLGVGFDVLQVLKDINAIKEVVSTEEMTEEELCKKFLEETRK